MSIQTTADIIIHEEVYKIFTKPLEGATTFLSSGVTIVDSSNPIKLPLLERSNFLPTYVGEGDLIPDNQINQRYVEALPTSLKGIMGWWPFTKQAVRSSVAVGLSSQIKERALAETAEKLDRVFYTGHPSGTNAVQKITITATDGTFTVTYKGQTTSGLAYNITAANLQTAIRGLSTIGSSNVTVTGSTGGPYTVTFVSALAATQVDLLVVDDASLTGSGEVELITMGIEAGGIKGIFNQAGTQSAELDTSDLDCLIDAITVAEDANVAPNRWYMNPSDFNAFRKIHRGTGDVAYVLDPDPHKGTIPTLFGIPVTKSTFIPKGKAALADTKYATVVRDENVDLQIFDQTLAQKNSMAVRATVRMDLTLTRPEAWVILA